MLLDKFDEMVRKLRAAPSWDAARKALGVADDTPEGWAAHAVWVMLGKGFLHRPSAAVQDPAFEAPHKSSIQQTLPEDIQAAYYVGIHRYSWRAGKPLQILGVVFCRPDAKSTLRECYLVQDHVDGVCDYMAISDRSHYAIINRDDVEAGRIPQVSQ